MEHLYIEIFICSVHLIFFKVNIGGRRGRDRMVVGFTTTCGISANVVSSNPAQAWCT